MHNTSISTGFNYDIPIFEQIPMIKEAGFTHISLGKDYSHSGLLEEERLNQLYDAIINAGLKVDTIHGYDLDQPDYLEVNEKVAKAAKKLGAKTVVVHCSAFEFPDTQYEDKYAIVSKRIKNIKYIAEKNNVKFAFENVVPGLPTKLCEEMIEIGNSDYIGFCYDSSHDQIDGPRNMELLCRQNNKLTAVHLSDRIKEFVDHVIPGEGFINFDEMLPLLKQSGFDGPILMEVEMTHSKYKNIKEFLKKAHEAADRFANYLYR